MAGSAGGHRGMVHPAGGHPGNIPPPSEGAQADIACFRKKSYIAVLSSGPDGSEYCSQLQPPDQAWLMLGTIQDWMTSCALAFSKCATLYPWPPTDCSLSVW